MMISRLMDIMVVNGRLTKFLNAPTRPVKLLEAESSYEQYRPPGSTDAPVAALGGQLPGHFVDVRPAPSGAHDTCAVFRAVKRTTTTSNFWSHGIHFQQR